MFERVLYPPFALDLLAIGADASTVVDHVGRVLISDEFVSDLITAVMGPLVDLLEIELLSP